MRKNSPDLPKPTVSRLRCAIYTRKSTEEGLDQEFNSLDAQREAAEAFIQSQRREGWVALPGSMTMVVSPVPTWTVRHWRDCSWQWKRASWIVWWCIKWIA